MLSLSLLGLFVYLFPPVTAQSSVWGQCGGINWSGPTTCVASSSCVKVNDWYFQCQPSTSSVASTTSTKPATTSKTSSPATTSTGGTTGSGTGKFWFSFGDSYTQTGFTVTGTQPSTSNQFGNPAYPGYTACGSVPNWIDYAATTMNSVAVYNYAYGGATIDASLVTPYTSTVLSLIDQVKEFLNNHASGKSLYPGWSSSNSIFTIWIGINDIGNSYGQSGDRPTFDAKLISRYFDEVTALYNAGARHFLFLTVPPIDRSPLMLAQATSARSLEKTVIADYNSKLAAAASAFASSHSGVTTQIYDTQPIVNAILDNPSSYGLKDATSYGSATNLAWCNDYHIAPPVHQQIAKGVAAILKGTYI